MCEQVYQRRQLFDRYVVLGVNLVIVDREVAQVYEQALGESSVTNTYQKSIGFWQKTCT